MTIFTDNTMIFSIKIGNFHIDLDYNDGKYILEIMKNGRHFISERFDNLPEIKLERFLEPF